MSSKRINNLTTLLYSVQVSVEKYIGVNHVKENKLPYHIIKHDNVYYLAEMVTNYSKNNLFTICRIENFDTFKNIRDIDVSEPLHYKEYYDILNNQNVEVTYLESDFKNCKTVFNNASLLLSNNEQTFNTGSGQFFVGLKNKKNMIDIMEML